MNDKFRKGRRQENVYYLGIQKAKRYLDSYKSSYRRKIHKINELGIRLKIKIRKGLKSETERQKGSLLTSTGFEGILPI